MDYDISQPVPQGSNGTQDSENRRIATIADELQRLCAVYEAQCRNSRQDVSLFDIEQRIAEPIEIAQERISFYHSLAYCISLLLLR